VPGRRPGPRGVAADAICDTGEGTGPGVAVLVGCLRCGVVVGPEGGSVLPQTTSPHPPAPERTEWPDRVIIMKPATTAIPRPMPNSADRGRRASAARHRPPPLAWRRPALPPSQPLAGSDRSRVPAEDLCMFPPCDHGWLGQCSNGEVWARPKPNTGPLADVRSGGLLSLLPCVIRPLYRDCPLPARPSPGPVAAMSGRSRLPRSRGRRPARATGCCSGPTGREEGRPGPVRSGSRCDRRRCAGRCRPSGAAVARLKHHSAPGMTR
jgi:hypothetical protein